MAQNPSSDKKQTDSQNSPQPEVLKPQAAKTGTADTTGGAPSSGTRSPEAMKAALRRRPMAHRPSHKATFIGLAVIVGILAINAGVIFFLMRSNASLNSQIDPEAVTLSTETLDSLGVNRTPVGNSGTELVVGPNSRFGGKVTVGGDLSVSGQFQLNSKLTASDASLARLEAGETSLGQLNVNGDGTVTSLNTRQDLNVAGSTRLQGPVVVSQLLTVTNGLNVTGNLAVGGVLSARAFQANNLVSENTLTIGGHIITRGSAPGVAPGNALGSNGTVSISGTDTAGTVAANIGVGAGSGIVATVTFRTPYGNTPRVVVTPVGRGVGSIYINRNANGFSIGVNGSMAPGGYAFDYIVMQ